MPLLRSTIVFAILASLSVQDLNAQHSIPQNEDLGILAKQIKKPPQKNYGRLLKAVGRVSELKRNDIEFAYVHKLDCLTTHSDANDFFLLSVVAESVLVSPGPLDWNIHLLDASGRVHDQLSFHLSNRLLFPSPGEFEVRRIEPSSRHFRIQYSDVFASPQFGHSIRHGKKIMEFDWDPESYIGSTMPDFRNRGLCQLEIHKNKLKILFPVMPFPK